jgi:hypothetical protein
MTPDLVDLALRAVACKGWRWMPGMLTDDGTTVCSQSDDGYLLIAGSEGSCVSWWPIGGHLPDLTDPATVGCLLALVREAYEDDFIGLEYDAPLGKWGAYAAEKGVWSTRLRGEGNTEAEALVVALEAAP